MLNLMNSLLALPYVFEDEHSRGPIVRVRDLYRRRQAGDHPSTTEWTVAASIAGGEWARGCRACLAAELAADAGCHDEHARQAIKANIRGTTGTVYGYHYPAGMAKEERKSAESAAAMAMGGPGTRRPITPGARFVSAMVG
jgi:hypothetical protein